LDPTYIPDPGKLSWEASNILSHPGALHWTDKSDDAALYPSGLILDVGVNDAPRGHLTLLLSASKLAAFSIFTANPAALA
jgi:hypothetical protein